MINRKMLVDAYDFFNSEDENFKKELEIGTILVQIASNFLKYRDSKNMSQKELASELGITQAMVSKLESGEYNPTVKFLAEISQKLNWDFSVHMEIHVEDPEYYFKNIENGSRLPTNEEDIYSRGLAV